MPDKNDTKREPPISYRPPKDLRAAFHERVQNSGLSKSAFITQAIFGDQAGRSVRRLPIEKALLARLLGEAADIRAALHEIAQADLDEAESARRIDAAMADLSEIRAALIKAYGRQP